MFGHCPGSLPFRTPQLKIKNCPECGGEVEIFSDESKALCLSCGFTVYNDLISCLEWCRYARQCVGDEVYARMKKIKIAFICVGNSCRSQMAEALAKKYFKNPRFGFFSAGSNPAQFTAPKTLEVLKEEGIDWRGAPKTLKKIPPPDIVVTMGCEVSCPVLPEAKFIHWEIFDPVGKGIDEYRRVKEMIKEKILELRKELKDDQS